MHVFGPSQVYPAAVGARYTLPHAPWMTYQDIAAAVGIERVVLVQPSFYGFDNTYLLDVLRGPSSSISRRGVVMLGDEIPTKAVLRDWEAVGVRGIRLDFFKAIAQGRSHSDLQRMLFAACDIAAALQWSVDLYIPGMASVTLLPSLKSLPCPVTIAHLGFLRPEEVSDADCGRFIDELCRPTSSAWTKLTGLYRYGDSGRRRSEWLAQQLIDNATDRVLWGSDWPHVMAEPQDPVGMLNHLEQMCPDIGKRTKILVDNPARLFRF